MWQQRPKFSQLKEVAGKTGAAGKSPGKGPVIGLALSGGGLRGAAHIGVLQALEARGIHADMVAGTSAGSVVGMLYALGWKPEAMEEWLLKLHSRDFIDYISDLPTLARMGLRIVLDRLKLPHGWLPATPQGLIRGKKWEKLLFELSRGMHSSQCNYPLFITATDLCSGELVCFCPPHVDPATEQQATGSDFLSGYRSGHCRSGQYGYSGDIPASTVAGPHPAGRRVEE